jgi:hypothetical protein
VAPYGGCRGPLSKDIANAIHEALAEDRACRADAAGLAEPAVIVEVRSHA